MLRLTGTQAGLLVAMTGAVNTHVEHGRVWIAQHRFPLADLYVLRAARLVGAKSAILGACGYREFEVTDRGTVEALRLSGTHQSAGSGPDDDGGQPVGPVGPVGSEPDRATGLDRAGQRCTDSGAIADALEGVTP